MKKRGFASVDAYIEAFPKGAQEKLREMRRLIREIAPEAQEKISYQMPAYFLNGPLVYFGAHTRHIGFYPTGSGITRFKAELAGYPSSKGAVQFPLDQPLPRALITRIVTFRLEENKRKKK